MTAATRARKTPKAQPRSKKVRVAIIGAGIAGLAAAAKLAEQDIKTTLFEAGSQLGGRARSVAVEFNGQAVQLDNGQHILLGAYHETLKLLAQVEVREEQAFMRLPLVLEALTPNGKLAFKLSAPSFCMLSCTAIKPS